MKKVQSFIVWMTLWMTMHVAWYGFITGAGTSGLWVFALYPLFFLVCWKIDDAIF